ncbi:hypothetical protein ACF8EF_22270 [Pseudomonas sp. zjy_15]|uniref:hypothetical protein n=1 Tax=unclassified Pseudomonas TaxID=196821 RepID=UPI00370A8262
MKYLDTTAGSTHATNVAITTYMPPAEATAVLEYLDRYQALEAEIQRLEAEVARLTPDDAHARQCRSADIEALVLQALGNATLLTAIKGVSPCFRATKVRNHLIRFKDDGTPGTGVNQPRYKFERPPTRDTITAILIKHGYYF